MKKEIKTREDVELLVNSFYEKILKDDLLKPVFVDIAQINLKEHLPILHDFWESVLFGTSAYKGNPMSSHLNLNQKTKLSPELFGRWLDLFTETVNENFKGTKADEAKTRAKTIAQLMQFKIEEMNKGN
jgi:hemoglobin